MKRRPRRERHPRQGRWWWLLAEVLVLALTLGLLFAESCTSRRPDPPTEEDAAVEATPPSLLPAEGPAGGAATPGLRTRPAPGPAGDPPPAVVPDASSESTLPLTVRFVDALEGVSVAEVRWRPGTGPVVAHGAYDTVATRPVPVVPGRERRIGLQVDEESLGECVAWDETRWPVVVSRFARSLAAVYPLRREARVSVFVREADGSPSEDARVERFRVGDRSSTPPAQAVPDRGGFLLRGVPFFREEPVTVLAVRAGEEVSTDSEDVDIEVPEELGDRGGWGAPAFLEWLRGAAVGAGRLPRSWRERLVITATFPHETDVRIPWGGFAPGDPRSGESRMSLAPDPRQAVVEVVVRRHDGTPAPDVELRFFQQYERTDANGRAVFRRILAGTRVLELIEPGLVYTRQSVVVEESGRHRVALTEARGGRLRVRVVDASGEPLPFAEVRPERRARWVALGANGIQRIDRFTDPEGERLLERLPPGTWSVFARWSGRYGRARVTVEEGGQHTVTIPVMAPK